MVKETPNIGYFLAEQAVRDYFNEERYGSGMDFYTVTTRCRIEQYHIADAYMKIREYPKVCVNPSC